MHSLTPRRELVPKWLSEYLDTKFARSLRISPLFGTYECYVKGNTFQKTGIHSTLRRRFYSHYPKEASRRRRTKTKSKGSTKKIGIAVDTQIFKIVAANKVPSRINKLTRALLEHWKSAGHTLIAAQVPVYVASLDCVTQADCITRHNDTYTMWEVKTGFPVGGFRKHGKFTGAPFETIDCTKYNIWQLQRKYTHDALVEAGLKIDDSRVIQVYSHADKGVVIKELTKFS
jgi:hypothetical protein